jgi:hypothetical protein
LPVVVFGFLLNCLDDRGEDLDGLLAGDYVAPHHVPFLHPVDGDGVRLLKQDVDLVVERVFAEVAHGDEHLLVLAVFHEVVELLVDLTGDEVHLFLAEVLG